MFTCLLWHIGCASSVNAKLQLIFRLRCCSKLILVDGKDKMRFLNTVTFEIISDDDLDYRADPRYAILSHRWVGAEITFQTLRPADLMDLSLDTPQLNKIRGACARATQETPALKWLWDDTCCIDKTNAVEEARSINSMFAWYANATVCYAYLHDVVWSTPGLQMFKSQDPKRKQHGLESEWFDRGWTLQELLAPRVVEFYDRDWKPMGTKNDLASVLQGVTGIGKKFLTGESKIHQASVATRMSWMAGRTTKEMEDIAYSMIGIFGITMTPQHGEGMKSFIRLQKTIMESSADESIFAWTTPANGLTCFRRFDRTPEFSPQAWGMLAPSPDCFKNSGDVIVIPEKIITRLNGGYRWSQRGVHFDLAGMPVSETKNVLGITRSEISLALNCWRYDRNGTLLTIVLELGKTNNGWCRKQCHILGQKRNAKPSTNRLIGIDQLIIKPVIMVQPELIRVRSPSLPRL